MIITLKRTIYFLFKLLEITIGVLLKWKCETRQNGRGCGRPPTTPPTPWLQSDSLCTFVAPWLVINVLFYLLCIIKKSVISKTTSWQIHWISIEDIVQLSVQTSEGYSYMCVYMCNIYVYIYNIQCLLLRSIHYYAVVCSY